MTAGVNRCRMAAVSMRLRRDSIKDFDDEGIIPVQRTFETRSLRTRSVGHLPVAFGTDVLPKGSDVIQKECRLDARNSRNNLREKRFQWTCFTSRQTTISFAISVNAFVADPLLNLFPVAFIRFQGTPPRILQSSSSMKTPVSSSGLSATSSLPTKQPHALQ